MEGMRVCIPDETLKRLREFEETAVKERTDVDYKSLYKTVNNAVVILSNEIYGLADKINATENLPEQIKYTHQLAGVAQEWVAMCSLKRSALYRYLEEKRKKREEQGERTENNGNISKPSMLQSLVSFIKKIVP